MWAWFIFGIPLGFLLIKYFESITDAIGPIGWVESILGAGGTYTFIKLLGIIIVVVSFIYPLGGCDRIIGGTIGRFF